MEHLWGDTPITREQAESFAKIIPFSPQEQATIAHNLFSIPLIVRSRGIFFDGLSRILIEAKGEPFTKELLQKAGFPKRIITFRSYFHRDFYKLYYLSAPLLHPNLSAQESVRRVALTFYPMFRSSFIGKTMSALMGNNPRTMLPLLAKAYNISVEGNSHAMSFVGEREAEWSCTVEPNEWYADTFTGILSGAISSHDATQIQITVKDRAPAGELSRYVFRIIW
jgi:uncharacterized protein (TIGR02265 family)